MHRTAPVVRMHARQWFALLVLPTINLSIAFVIIIAIGVIANMAGGPLDGMYEGMRWNGALWAGIGQIMAFGITAMLQFFPLSLGLGLTRREFIAGTSIVMVGIAAIYALLITVLKAIEQATGGWGLRVRMFDTIWVSDGTVGQTLLQSFLVLLMGMAIGVALTTVYQRFGQNALWFVFGGLAALGLLGTGLVLVVASIRDWFWSALSGATWGTWMVVLVAVTAVCALVWTLLVRRAPVR